MVLSYSLKTEYDEETGEIKERKAYLVYRPEKGYVSVDAYTGEVYTERNTWTVNETGKNMAGSGGGILMDSMAMAAHSFRHFMMKVLVMTNAWQSDQWL